MSMFLDIFRETGLGLVSKEKRVRPSLNDLWFAVSRETSKPACAPGRINYSFSKVQWYRTDGDTGIAPAVTTALC